LGAASSGGAQAIIGPSTTDVYGIKAGLKIRFPQAEQLRPTPGMVWVLNAAAEPQPRRVILGITNGRETAVLDGELKEGETVVTGELGDEDAAAAAAQQRGGPLGSPFGGARGGRRGGR
jgi:hypothetical protein